MLEQTIKFNSNIKLYMFCISNDEDIQYIRERIEKIKKKYPKYYLAF